jgi:hypothetical protein
MHRPYTMYVSGQLVNSTIQASTLTKIQTNFSEVSSPMNRSALTLRRLQKQRNLLVYYKSHWCKQRKIRAVSAKTYTDSEGRTDQFWFTYSFIMVHQQYFQQLQKSQIIFRFKTQKFDKINHTYRQNTCLFYLSTNKRLQNDNV